MIVTALVILALTIVGSLYGVKNYSLGYMTSGSMEGTIGEGSLYVVKKTKDVEVGDIIRFDRGDHSNVVHRVVGKAPEGLVTKGDNNSITDQKAGYDFVDKQDVKGKVVKVLYRS